MYAGNLYSTYDFLEFNADMVKKVLGVGFGVNLTLLAVILIIYVWTDKTKKSEIAVVHGIRILPFCSVKYMMVIAGIVFSIF